MTRSITDVPADSDFAFSPETIDLSALGEKASGAKPRGWYPATIVEGFVGRSGDILTEVTTSKAGDSYNFRICARIKFADEEKTLFTSLNYRPEDFTPERIATIQRLRTELAGQRGRWEGFEDEQRSSLALGKLGQLQNATGTPITFLPGGGKKINVAPFLGNKLYVHVNIDEETGYNEIDRFSMYPSGVAPKPRAAKADKK